MLSFDLQFELRSELHTPELFLTRQKSKRDKRISMMVNTLKSLFEVIDLEETGNVDALGFRVGLMNIGSFFFFGLHRHCAFLSF